MPVLRHTSSTRVLCSAWRNMNAICCSVNFDLLIHLSSVGDRKPNREFSHFEWLRKWEAGHAKLRNQDAFKHPARNDPLSDSMKALSVGLPG